MRKAQVGVAIPYLAKHQYSFLGKHTKKRAIQPISTLASEGGIPSLEVPDYNMNTFQLETSVV